MLLARVRSILHGMTTPFDTYLAKIQTDVGYDADHIAAERAKIKAFDAANQAQEMAKGAAQQASQDQEAALKQPFLC